MLYTETCMELNKTAYSAKSGLGCFKNDVQEIACSVCRGVQCFTLSHTETCLELSTIGLALVKT